LGDQDLLAALPLNLRRELEHICEALQRKPIALVREIVAFYKGRTTEGVKVDISGLSPEFCEQVQAIAATLRGHKTTGAMTPEEIKERARKGGLVKAQKARERKAAEATGQTKSE
jgi:hypothetical protein